MAPLAAHLVTVILFWLAASVAVSALLTYLFQTPVFLGFIAVGLAGGAWSSYQAYRKYHG